jgi:NADH dehydrogenase (ubiquinone) 1 alpha subcomplex subunit 13
MWSRIHLIPLLLAEADRKDYRAQQAVNAVERMIMQDVKGWEVRVPWLLTEFD